MSGDDAVRLGRAELEQASPVAVNVLSVGVWLTDLEPDGSGTGTVAYD
jgi:hypothetical protein